MPRSIQEYIEICNWDSASFFFFSDNVFGTLVYYSHLLPLVAALILGLFVFSKNPKLLSARWLLVTTTLLAVWLFADLVLWATDKPAFTMFFWSLLVLVEPMVYAAMLFFIYALVDSKDISLWKKALIFLMLLPTVIFAPTSLALTQFDLSNCWREAIEGPLAYYGYAIQLCFTFWILGFGLSRIYQAKESKKRIEILFATIGAVLFLLSFALGNVIGSLLNDWEIGQYGLFGIPVFAAVLSYLTVQFNSFKFNVQLVAAQVIVSALWLLTFSILFLRSIESVRVIIYVTLVLFAALGYMLVKSIKKEVEQKRLAQKLANELAGANARLERLDKMKSEFVSIASHQLRSPLTSVRGYISMILEGSYGEINAKAKEVLTHVSEASRHMALSIEDYLNVSRIEAGNMKYDITDVDITKLTEELVAEMQPVGAKKGIPIVFKPEFSGQLMVKLDIGKARQIIQNLIDNALKYTKDKGEVIITLRKDEATKKVCVDVKDQGIGIDSEEAKHLFEKFERAKNANQINTTGTGLGLYIARTMARAMSGDIGVSSAGEGKGSTFTVSFPMNGIASSWATKA
jgi:signal transduction histidine kinase